MGRGSDSPPQRTHTAASRVAGRGSAKGFTGLNKGNLFGDLGAY